LEVLRRTAPITHFDNEVQKHLEVGKGNCKIFTITSADQWTRVYPEVVRDLRLLPVLGLDCEWVSQKGRVSPVSLLQLSTISGLCVLIRLFKMKSIPATLRELLASNEIYKVGVAVNDDKSKLLRDYTLDVYGCVDLRHLVVNYWNHEGKLGLESLASLILGVKLDKDWRIRASDWEKETFDQRQETYAANDSLVAINMTWIIISKFLRRNLLQWFQSLFYTQKQIRDNCVQILDQFSDLTFSNQSQKRANKTSKEKSQSPKGTKLRMDSVRKSPLYHNCLLQAPDGQVLCTSDVKKAMWYINKGIGYKVCDDPLTVRLKFEPSGRPEGKAGEYYLSVKPNVCVVCGKDESFSRKSVVPHEYRKYFPAVMKDHQSHDVLLLCIACHQKSNYYDLDVRRHLAELCNAPIGSESSVKIRANFELKKVKSAGRALKMQLDNKDPSKTIPADRMKELEFVLKEHYDVEVITEDIIESASNCDFKEENDDYVPHSRAVVQYYLENGGLLQLEVMWRKHFLDKMKPKFLPPLWSVDHQEERLGVKAAEKRIDMAQYKLATEGTDTDLDLEAYRQTKQSQLGINPDLDLKNEIERDRT